MLKGKQKKLDKNKDGKISGEDFKMMKARYGTMAKGNVSEALQKEKVKKDDNELTKIKLIKKLRGAQVGPAEEAALDKLTPSEVKKKLASMSKAKHGKMIKANKGKDIDIIEAITNKSLMGQGLLTQMKSAKKSAKKKNMGGEMKSTKGYGAARTSGMGLQDESLKSGQNYEITKGGDYIKDLI
jgi:hypothetical protein